MRTNGEPANGEMLLEPVVEVLPVLPACQLGAMKVLGGHLRREALAAGDVRQNQQRTVAVNSSRDVAVWWLRKADPFRLRQRPTAT